MKNVLIELALGTFLVLVVLLLALLPLLPWVLVIVIGGGLLKACGVL